MKVAAANETVFFADVLAFMHRQVLRHTKKQLELRLKILYPFLPRLAVKARNEQFRIDHWHQKIEIWEKLQNDN